MHSSTPAVPRIPKKILHVRVVSPTGMMLSKKPPRISIERLKPTLKRKCFVPSCSRFCDRSSIKRYPGARNTSGNARTTPTTAKWVGRYDHIMFTMAMIRIRTRSLFCRIIRRNTFYLINNDITTIKNPVEVGKMMKFREGCD